MSDGKRAVEASKVWTVLITNSAYLPGLLTLDYSLKRVKSAYPLVALYTDTFPPEGHAALAARGIPSQRIEYLRPTKSTRDYSADPRFYDCWSKLTPFGLAQYSRIVQLDADMLALRNMDELMELELDPPELASAGNLDPAGGPVSRRVFAASHACVCNPLRKPHYPADWTRDNCAFTAQHADPDRAQAEGVGAAASPLGIPNGGLQVVNPSREIFAQIVAFMEEHAGEMDFADQSVLSALFRGRWVALPYVYNALKTMRWADVHAEIWRDESVKNMHYILTPNPWEELDAEGNSTSSDETHRWWAEVNLERRAKEKEKGVDDGF